jgi:hypothetical protein
MLDFEHGGRLRVKEAPGTGREARFKARGRGAQSKLEAARRLEQLADRTSGHTPDDALAPKTPNTVEQANEELALPSQRTAARSSALDSAVCRTSHLPVLTENTIPWILGTMEQWNNGTRNNGTRNDRRGALPPAIYLLAACLFAMGSSEFIISGVLADIATDLDS